MAATFFAADLLAALVAAARLVGRFAGVFFAALRVAAGRFAGERLAVALVGADRLVAARFGALPRLVFLPALDADFADFADFEDFEAARDDVAGVRADAFAGTRRTAVLRAALFVVREPAFFAPRAPLVVRRFADGLAALDAMSGLTSFAGGASTGSGVRAGGAGSLGAGVAGGSGVVCTARSRRPPPNTRRSRPIGFG